MKPGDSVGACVKVAMNVTVNASCKSETSLYALKDVTLTEGPAPDQPRNIAGPQVRDTNKQSEANWLNVEGKAVSHTHTLHAGESHAGRGRLLQC